MNDAEKAIFEVAQDQLSTFAQRLGLVGLKWVGPEYEVWKADLKTYTSELRVKFFRQNELVDIFEFHIYRDGELLAAPEEVVEWFRTYLRELITKS